MKIVWLLLILFFSACVHAEINIEYEGDGVVLDHTEETNVTVPDELKNMEPTSKPDESIPESTVSE